jgi:dihydrofolate reductase
MIISFVVAVARNGVIGKNNDLPWRLPDDMKFFLEKTTGHHVIMGRKNYESLPKKFKPLPNRTNIVITRNSGYNAPGCIIVGSLEKAFSIAEQNGEKEAMVIGGSEIFELALPYANRLFITEIHADVEGDVYFPEFDKKEWKEVSRVPHAADARHQHAFDFVLYEK